MLDYLAMSYKNFDYTIMIALMCWPKMYNFGIETHLGVELWVLLSSVNRHCLLQISLAVQLSGKALKDSDCTAMNAVVHW